MAYLQGLRVVRGPDWKWSDQDGGDGHVGTVVYINKNETKQKLLRPKMVSVVWDSSGVMADYRAGPKGSYDLRVADNTTTGVKHPGVSCYGPDCSVKEILGTLWQCVTCNINLCTKCFMKETPHHPDHNRFKRYDNSEMNADASIVSSWGEDGPKKRVKMIGMGYYHPGALAPLDSLDDNKDKSYFPFRSPSNIFCIGDRVILSAAAIRMDKFFKEVLKQVKNVEKVMGATGIVESVGDSDVLVHFVEKEIKLRVNHAVILKLNQFSINQVVRIRDDMETVRGIEKDFEIICNDLEDNQPQGAIGRVTGFSSKNPDELFIQFDKYKIYDWMGRYSSVPSSWLELYETIQPAVDEELVELDLKAVKLFIKAVYSGDLRTAKILHTRYGIDLDGRNEEGQTALHIACHQGHTDIVRWLLDHVAIDLEKSDNLNRREIHHAVARCDPSILEMILDFKIDMDSRTKSGETALDIAVKYEFKDCARLLIKDQAKCNVNIQDSNGNTPLHRAVQRGSTEMIGILISSGRIDWNLRNKKELNILSLSIYMKNRKIIAYFLKEDKEFIFEWASKKGHNVLFYASMYKNIKVIKLLLDDQSVSSTLKSKLLETKTIKSGMTPLLYSCWKKTSAIMELLIDYGADLKATDEDGNTAIIIAILSTSKDEIPLKERSPSIYKLYQDESDFKKYPILSLLAYLIQKGCCWEKANKGGKMASDILLEKGYTNEIVELLNQMAPKWKRWTIGPNGCMGKKGECVLQATFRLSCTHKAIFDTCSDCVQLTFKQKCGCSDEDMSSILAAAVPDALQPHSAGANADENNKEVVNERRLDVLKWTNDGTEKGYIEDQSGNKFQWNKRTRQDRAIGYRCVVKSNGDKCPAIARRYFSEKEEDRAILLETPHNHSSSILKRNKRSASKRRKTTSEGSSSRSSGSKRKRRYSVDQRVNK